MNDNIELSIIMPCLDEAGTVEVCVKKAKKFLEVNKISGEVIVVDNRSADDSANVAKNAGAKIILASERGYGNALREGLKSASGKYIITGDADDTYDFSALSQFLEKLRAGSDIVIGNRFRGEIKKEAMPFLHRYFGNPAITWFGNFLFGYICGDFYCGLRGFKREKILEIELIDDGIQSAVEVLIKGKLKGFKIGEVPTILYPALSGRRSKLSRWKDGAKTMLLFLKLKWHCF